MPAVPIPARADRSARRLDTGLLGAFAQSIAAAQDETDLAPGKVRRKMAVGEGRSMMHWMNVRPKIKRQRWVTMEEIKQVANGAPLIPCALRSDGSCVWQGSRSSLCRAHTSTCTRKRGETHTPAHPVGAPAHAHARTCARELMRRAAAAIVIAGAMGSVCSKRGLGRRCTHALRF